MINKKIIIKGTVELMSPALIGCGREENTDMDVILDIDGKPYIPATSFIGVLKHNLEIQGYDAELKQFWGYTEGDKGKQSSIFCKHLYCLGDAPSIVIRDGIKINNQTGMVEKGAKYDYEIIEKGGKFILYLEISAIQDSDDFSLRMAKTIGDLLESGDLYIGAKTNNGLGNIKVIEPEIFIIDFQNPKHVLAWLKKDFSAGNKMEENIKPFPYKKPNFILNATFSLYNSLIIRSYTENNLLPDSVHIKSGENFVLPGTSLKGAIRSRVNKILNTLGIPPEINNNLFGNVDEKTNDKLKSRIRIDESVLPQYTSEVHTRIKIDRFTAGTISGSLFDTMPVYSGNNDNLNFNLSITIRDCRDYEAGLLLLILKDLWTGDLAIGGEKNIGRGVIKGISATITFNGDDFFLKEGFNNLTDQQTKLLNSWVAKLVELKKGGKTDD